MEEEEERRPRFMIWTGSGFIQGKNQSTRWRFSGRRGGIKQIAKCIMSVVTLVFRHEFENGISNPQPTPLASRKTTIHTYIVDGI